MFIAFALLLGSCTTRDPLYCDQSEPCTDPARPFCDLAGEYPASDGIARTCIPEPASDPGSDAGTDGEPDGGDAPPRDGFQLEASSVVGVEQGKSASLELQVVRGEDFAEVVTVDLTGLPPGVSSDPISISASSDTGTLTLTAASEAEQGGPTPATVSATGGGAMASAEVAVMVRGAPGTLDTSFGKAGSTTTDFSPRDIAIQADGKLILTGERATDVAVQRIMLDGTRDQTFGTDGALIFPGDAAGYDYGNALAEQEDGKILIGGEAANAENGFDSLVARISPNGTLDADFGTGGKVLIELNDDNPDESNTDSVEALAVLPDNRILAACLIASNRVALLRLHPGGEIDSTFGVNGRAVFNAGALTSISGIALQEDGKVVIAGSRGGSSVERDIMVLRALPTGSPDPDFGEGGRVFLPARPGKPGRVLVYWLYLDGDRIIVGGESLDEGFVMRLTPDGQADSTFDGDGYVLFPGTNAIAGLHMEPDDTMFVIGSRSVGSTPSGFASRLTASGAPDRGFGERMFALDAEFFRTAFTDDGRVFVVGGDSPPTQPLVRIWR